MLISAAAAAAAAAPAPAAAAAAACMLQVTPGSEDGWVKVKLTTAGTGWLGFGVAHQGELLLAHSLV
jgi:hypothetical protein